MSVEITENEDPTLIVNIDDPAAKGAIKRVLIWLFGLGGLIELVRRSVSRPVVLAVAGTATVVSIGTLAVTEVTRDGEPHRPPLIAKRTVTAPAIPAVTITASATPSKAAETTQPPQKDEQPPHLARTSPPRPAPDIFSPQERSTATPTRRTRAPSPEPEAPTTRAAQEDRPLNAGSSTSDEPAPESTSAPDPPARTDEPAPAPAASPTQAAAGCDGVVKVALDPLVDLCLLD